MIMFYKKIISIFISAVLFLSVARIGMFAYAEKRIRKLFPRQRIITDFAMKSVRKMQAK